MNVTDVIGFTLKDAKGILAENGIKEYSIKVTSSPRLKSEDYDDTYRVVSIRETNVKNFEMIVCKPL